MARASTRWRRPGLRVIVGEQEEVARRLNEAYFKWVDTHLPFVTLKYAMTVDGKIATQTGSSFWITGPEARRCVAELRSQVDAIMVGIGTILADDPQLTARPEEFGLAMGRPVHQPIRVILDSTLRLPVTARVVSGGLPGRTLVFTTDRASTPRIAELEAQGVEIQVVRAAGRASGCPRGAAGAWRATAHLSRSRVRRGACGKSPAHECCRQASGLRRAQDRRGRHRTKPGGRGWGAPDGRRAGAPQSTVGPYGPRDVLLTAYVDNEHARQDDGSARTIGTDAAAGVRP